MEGCFFIKNNEKFCYKIIYNIINIIINIKFNLFYLTLKS